MRMVTAPAPIIAPNVLDATSIQDATRMTDMVCMYSSTRLNAEAQTITTMQPIGRRENPNGPKMPTGRNAAIFQRKSDGGEGVQVRSPNGC